MTDVVRPLQPEGWAPAPGYAYATVSEGRLLHVAAVAGIDPATFQFDPALDLLGQWRQALTNLRTIVEAAGATMRDVVSIRVYVGDMDEYQLVARDVGRLHHELFEGHRPAATMLGVAAFAAPEARVEIESVVALRDRA